MRTRSVGFVAGLALLAAACGVSEAAPQASGPSEGIAVHGDWMIDVYDPDGALDRHYEFSNALRSSGASFLAGILGGSVYPGTWVVQLYSQGDDDPCITPTGDPAACSIYQPFPAIEDLADSAASMNLEVQHDGNELVLRGSHVASADGRITHVTTTAYRCDQPLSAIDCSEEFFGQAAFTFKQLEAEDVVEVFEGQSIQVEVVISFTSG